MALKHVKIGGHGASYNTVLGAISLKIFLLHLNYLEVSPWSSSHRKSGYIQPSSVFRQSCDSVPHAREVATEELNCPHCDAISVRTLHRRIALMLGNGSTPPSAILPLCRSAGAADKEATATGHGNQHC